MMVQVTAGGGAPGDAPNGFMKLLRRVVSVTCFALFVCGIVFEFFLNKMGKPLGIQLYILLLATAIGFTGPVFNLFSKIGKK